LPIAGFVFARLFARRGKRGWAACSAISGFAMFAIFFLARLSLRPGFEDMAGLFGLFQRLTVTIGWTWLTLLAAYMLTAQLEIPNATRKQVS
jgi:hypothetical protein